MSLFIAPLVKLVVLDVVMVLCAAALRRAVCPDKPLAFHTLVVWAVVVLFANFGNEMSARPLVILLMVAIGVAALTAFSRFPGPATNERSIRDERRDIVTVLAALGLQITLFLVPLTIFPSDTLITGYITCNDAVMHAITMLGLGNLTGPFADWPWLGYYPAGFHAVVFALRPVFGFADVPTFLLPVSIWGTSFLSLAILMLLHEERYPGRWGAVLIAASPAAAFLVGTSVYLGFVGHISVLPFLVGCLVVAASWKPADLRGRGLVMVLALVAAAAATYGLVALTAIGLAVALRIGYAFRQPARLPAIARETMRGCLVPSALIGALVVLILVVPVARRIVTGYDFFAAQTSTTGNLPNGFLSPFHITGLWRGGLEYRSQLSGVDSSIPMILVAILFGQVWIVARANLSRASIVPLLTLAAPVVASAIVVRSPYVNFKYLCFFAALWVPLVMLGSSRVVLRLTGGRTALSTAALAGAVLVLALTPLQSYRLLPALPERWFREMALVRDNHLRLGPVLVLSKEDWFHYYRDGDDVIPLTYMFPMTYDGRPVREVLVDSIAIDDALAFLARRLPGTETRLGICASDFIGGRYRIYKLSCLTGERP